MQREKPVQTRPFGAVALALCLAGTGVVTTGLAVFASAADAAPASARDAVDAVDAVDDGPHAPSDPTAQLTTSMMPASSPDAVAARALGARTSLAVHAFSTGRNAVGVDVSDYQHPGGRAVTWTSVRASGRSFAVVKATEGTTYVNSYVTGDAAGARRAGLTVGLYHFARPRLTGGSPTADAVAEANHFAAQVNAVGGTQLPPTLDLEVTGGLAPGQLAAWTGSFVARLQADTGRRPMIYTSPYFWNDDVASSAFGTYALWEAEYTSAAAPIAVRGWASWTMWQYTDGSFGSPGAVAGIAGSVDHDEVHGTTATLAAVASGSTGSVAPFTGTASAAAFPNGMLVRETGTTEVWVIAGRAPLYLPSMSDTTSRTVHVISAAQFDSLRSSPADGTFIRSHQTGQVYEIAGGAPVYVSSFRPFGRVPPAVETDQRVAEDAGLGGIWSHLHRQPVNGTFLRSAETNITYRIAGGAPVVVTSWASFGTPQPYIRVSDLAITRAGAAAGVYEHLRFTPAVGTYIADPLGGTYWVVGLTGVLVRTTDSGQGFVVEAGNAIANRGKAGVWSHLR